MQQLDADSLRLLDCKAPGAVESDRLELQGLIASRRVFGNFDEARRDRLWQRICVLTTDCLTPTLWGFFHNLKQLQLISTCLTSLVEVKDHSLRQTLQDLFQASRPDQFLIQVSPLQYRSIHAPGIDVDNFSIAYRQLWLYAWRHHEEMQPSPEKKLAGAQIKPANEIVMFGLANLASRLGFESDTINHLRERDPYRTMAHRHLRDLKQPGSRRSAKHEACVQSMIDCYVSAWEPANEGGTVGSEDEALSQNDEGAGFYTGGGWEARKTFARPRGPSKPTRCGLPRLRDHDKDKEWLFIHYMHNESVDEVFEISSLFAIRSLYKQIFHNMPPVSVDLNTSTAEIDCSSGLEHFYNQGEVQPVTSKTPTEDSREIDAYQAKVQESSRTIDELEKSIHERRQQYQQEETNLNNVKEQLRQAREQLSQTNDTHLDTGRVNDLEAQNNQYKQEVEGLRVKLRESRDREKAWMKKMSKLQQKLQDMKGKHEVIMKERLSISRQRDESLSQLEDLRTRLTIQEQEEETVLHAQQRKLDDAASDRRKTSWINTIVDRLKTGEGKLIYVTGLEANTPGVFFMASNVIFEEIAKGWAAQCYNISTIGNKLIAPQNGYYCLTADDDNVCSIILWQKKRKATSYHRTYNKKR